MRARSTSIDSFESTGWREAHRCTCWRCGTGRAPGSRSPRTSLRPTGRRHHQESHAGGIAPCTAADWSAVSGAPKTAPTVRQPGAPHPPAPPGGKESAPSDNARHRQSFKAAKIVLRMRRKHVPWEQCSPGTRRCTPAGTPCCGPWHGTRGPGSAACGAAEDPGCASEARTGSWCPSTGQAPSSASIFQRTSRRSTCEKVSQRVRPISTHITASFL